MPCWAVEEEGRLGSPSPSLSGLLSALPGLALCPRRLTLWDGITGLDSGTGEGQGGQQEGSVGEKVERMCRTCFYAGLPALGQ